MAETARLICDGESQAVRLPDEYRFAGSEVLIRRDPETGDVILSRKPFNWNAFFIMRDRANVPSDFLCEVERKQGDYPLDPFEWYDK